MTERVLNRAVVVAALGYFVDIFDILLFSIVRTQSLTDLGLSGEELLTEGMYLLRLQMAGMIVGGVLWGVLADKRGRSTVLFGSIITYSLATLLNAFVQNVDQYAVLRFVGGIGLAGELGAGITLVAESLGPKRRGIGTTIVASFGISGAVLAAIIAEFLDWRECYLVGGIMGLLLLGLRVSVLESKLYQRCAEQQVSSGNLLMLLGNSERALRLLRCILLGLPAWFVIGILISFAPEFGRAFGMLETPKAGTAIVWAYSGAVIGDLLCGALSQRLQSRRKALVIFYVFACLMIAVYLGQSAPTLWFFYLTCGAVGIGVGCWSVFITTAAEQFGTNLRGTVATSVPNFARGGLVPLSLGFDLLKPSVGLIGSAAVMGVITMVAALIAVKFTKESFHNDLDFVER